MIAEAKHKLPPLRNKLVLIKHDALNSDLIRAINSNIAEAIAQTKALAPMFDGGNANATAENIFNFLHQEVKYVKDQDGKQIIKLPNALIAYGGDCKSFALFTASILANLNYPSFFRYASYAATNPTPTHVYNYTKDETGKIILIDAVWGKFNEELKTQHTKNFKMQAYSLSGIGRKPRQHHDGSGAHNVKKYALSPGRGAFLALVSINARGLANKLKRLSDTNHAALVSLWEKRLGGKFSKLDEAIKVGLTKKPFLGEKINGIGVVAVAAALVAAAPVIAVVAKELKSAGIIGDDTEGKLENLLKDSGADAINPTDVKDDGTGDGTSGGGNKTLLIVGAAAVVAFFLLK